MSHGLDKAGWPSADTVLEMERKKIDALTAQLAAAERERDALQELLANYGQHTGPCCDDACGKWIQSSGDYFISEHHKCTCGLDAALERKP